MIFTGHSLGGLVVKQAPITAREHENTRRIIRNTIGIIFLGTSHKGSDQARWDGIAANSAKIPISRERNVSCDICKEECPDVFNHCVICIKTGYDVCRACLDKRNKCYDNHPLIYTDENAVNEAPPENEPIFPVTDPLEEFDVDDQESSI
jgi:hypothetical protein